MLSSWHTFFLGHVEDVYIVPIGINYEKLMDGDFSTEQLVCFIHVINEKFTVSMYM